MIQLAWNYRITDSTTKRYRVIECFYDKETGDIVAVSPITKEVFDPNILSKIILASKKPILSFEVFKDQLELQL